MPFDFTDSCGRTVTITEPITRVVVSGGVSQQVMLGFAPDLLVGLSTSMDSLQIKYFGDYNNLPVLGALYGGKGDLNKEAVAAAKPQIMIDWGEAKKTIVEDMDNLSTELGIPCVHIEAPIPAIASGNYLEIPGEPYNWLFGPPSVNQMLGMVWLSRTLYPDVFSDTAKDAVTEYFKLFYNHELTDAEYVALTANSVFKDGMAKAA